MPMAYTLSLYIPSVLETWSDVDLLNALAKHIGIYGLCTVTLHDMEESVVNGLAVRFIHENYLSYMDTVPYFHTFTFVDNAQGLVHIRQPSFQIPFNFQSFLRYKHVNSVNLQYITNELVNRGVFRS